MIYRLYLNQAFKKEKKGKKEKTRPGPEKKVLVNVISIELYHTDLWYNL